jgi:hypothetical protein
MGWLLLGLVGAYLLTRRGGVVGAAGTTPAAPRTPAAWSSLADQLERNIDDADVYARALHTLGYYDRTDGTFVGAFTRALRDAGIPTDTPQQQSDADERLAAWLIDRLRAGPAASTGSFGGSRRAAWRRF